MKFYLWNRNGVFYMKIMDGRKRISLKSLKTRDKTEAEQILEMTSKKYEIAIQKQDRIGQLLNSTGAGMTFKEMSDLYLEKHAKFKKSYTTYAQLAGHMCAYFGSYTLEQITPLMIEEYQNKRRQEVSNSTVNRHVDYLRWVYNKAVFWSKTKAENPAKHIKSLPESNVKNTFLEPDEIKALLENSPPHLKPIIIVGISTGIRSGNLFGLTWPQVDFNHDLIYLSETKSGKQKYARIGKFPKETLMELKKKAKSNDYVFTDEKGRRFKSVRRSLTTACKKAGIKRITLHDLRRTHASLLAMEGFGQYDLMQSMGISTSKALGHYVHLAPEYEKKTADSISKIVEEASK